MDPPALLSSHQGSDPGGNSALHLPDESSRTSSVSFHVHGGLLWLPFASVEKLSNALDLSVTKPAPTRYTFGIISCTGAHHTDSEELGSCGHLHNA